VRQRHEHGDDGNRHRQIGKASSHDGFDATGSIVRGQELETKVTGGCVKRPSPRP